MSLNFSPSPSPSVTKQMTQQTTTIEQPELEQKQKEKDSDGGETDKKETDGGQLETDELAKALKEAIGRGDVTIESLGDKVFVNFNNTTEDDNKKAIAVKTRRVYFLIFIIDSEKSKMTLRLDMFEESFKFIKLIFIFLGNCF